jgi:hypothetical protein
LFARFQELEALFLVAHLGSLLSPERASLHEAKAGESANRQQAGAHGAGC